MSYATNRLAQYRLEVASMCKRVIQKALVLAAVFCSAASVSLPVHATPIKYIFNAAALPVSGWFIYDRDTFTLSDYAISFTGTTYPDVTFGSPATAVVSPNHDGFKFTDMTTASSGVGSFDVTLGWPGYPPEHFLGAAAVRFFQQPIGTDVGDIYAPISYVGNNQQTHGGANMAFQSRFYSAGPVVPASAPAPGAIALLGLGLLGVGSARRRKAA